MRYQQLKNFTICFCCAILLGFSINSGPKFGLKPSFGWRKPNVKVSWDKTAGGLNEVWHCLHSPELWKNKGGVQQGRYAGANCWQTIKRHSVQLALKRAAAAAPPECKVVFWVNLPETRAGAEGDVRAGVSLHSAVVVAVVLQENIRSVWNTNAKTFNPEEEILWAALFAGDGEKEKKKTNFQVTRFWQVREKAVRKMLMPESRIITFGTKIDCYKDCVLRLCLT